MRASFLEGMSGQNRCAIWKVISILFGSVLWCGFRKCKKNKSRIFWHFFSKVYFPCLLAASVHVKGWFVAVAIFLGLDKFFSPKNSAGFFYLFDKKRDFLWFLMTSCFFFSHSLQNSSKYRNWIKLVFFLFYPVLLLHFFLQAHVRAVHCTTVSAKETLGCLSFFALIFCSQGGVIFIFYTVVDPIWSFIWLLW